MDDKLPFEECLLRLPHITSEKAVERLRKAHQAEVIQAKREVIEGLMIGSLDYEDFMNRAKRKLAELDDAIKALDKESK